VDAWKLLISELAVFVMVFRIRGIFPEILVYFLTGACVVGLLAGKIRAGRSAGDSPAGWRHLSLPKKVGLLDDPLSGWSVFEQPHSPEKMSDASLGMPAHPPPAVEEPVVDKPPRFEIVGVLNASDDQMYCFFDTNTRRWFWLAGGGENPELEVSLSIVDGQPKLMQAGSEVHYEVGSD